MTWRCALMAGLVCALAGCSSPPSPWISNTIPVITAPAATAPAGRERCSALDPDITAEARRVTPIAGVTGVDALTAALIGSEAAKNASLARLARAYEKCRRGASK